MKEYYRMASKTPYSLPFARLPLSAGPGAFVDNDFDSVDANLLLSENQPSNCILFQVTGDSCDPSVPHGSIAVVNRTIEPLNGHTIACSVDGLNHIKQFERKEAALWLVSPNTRYDPREVAAHDDFDVIGVVMWALVPTPRVIRRETQQPIYDLTDLSPVGSMFRARFESANGQPIEMTVAREALANGIKMATKALTRKVLTWRK
jgi:DNA polymerase V